MEFGNVYEVLQTGDIVKVKDLASIYCGHIGVIVSIDNPGCYVDPVYTVRFDEPYKTQFFNAKALVKVGHVAHEGEITMGLRSGKTYLTEIGKCKNKYNGFDSVIYQMEKERKFAERGTDEMKNVDVKKIIFNGRKTIVLWTDGTKTIVSMSKDETNFDPEAAYCAAYTKKMFGTNSKIKRVIKEKSNIEQHQRIVEEKLKEELAKISQDYDKFMRELCPWLYTGEKLTEVDSACANAISDFYKKEFIKGKDDECLGKLCPCHVTEETAKIQDKEKNNGNT